MVKGATSTSALSFVENVLINHYYSIFVNSKMKRHATIFKSY